MTDIDELFYDAVDLLKALIATERVSRREAVAASLIEQWCRERGMNPERIADNILLTAPGFDHSRATLLLNSHIDTVPPVEGWSRNPFDPTFDAASGCLYGLGSNDAGASLVSLLAVYRTLRDEECPYNLMFLASCQEEVSGSGGVEMMVDRLPQISLAVVGEPTGMRPAIAEKGLLVLDGEVRGVAGHAARDEGVNAIYKAMPIIERLRTLRLPEESAALGPVKISVTQIEAGDRHNVVPDRCRFTVDVRTTDAYSNLRTLELIREAAGPDCTLTPRSTRLNPSGIPASHPFVRRAKMLGLDSFGSPTLSDQALMPWPSVKIGPGDSARSHTADEFIVVDEIREAITVYLQLLRGLQP